MTHLDIQGWFSDSDREFYRKMVEAAPEGGNLVEVGCWLGKSTAYLAGLICSSDKHLTLRVYDTFEGSPNEPNMIEQAKQGPLDVVFIRNMIGCGFYFYCLCGMGTEPDVVASKKLAYQKLDSTHAAMNHPDASVDFVFIDACHTFEAVTADIRAWLPKVKPGGHIAGHDWQVYDDISRATRSTIGQVEVSDNCWFKKV